MKKNGFISTTLIYTFFILFLLLMIFLLNSYSSTRFLIEQYKYDIKNSFADSSLADINLYLMVWDPSTQEYEIQDSIPSFGYTYESKYSYCKNGSNISYVGGSVSISASRKDTCYAYFKETEKDIILKIYTKETVDSEPVLVNDIPNYSYSLTNSSCTNNASLTFDDNTRKFKIEASEKTVCEVEFTKRETDIVINVYLEDALGSHEYNGKNYQFTNSIPAEGYYFDSAVCQRDDTEISEVKGTKQLDVIATGKDECNVYYNGGDSRVELIIMQETEEGVSGYTTGKKYSSTSSIPSTGYKYVGYKCEDLSATVTFSNGTLEADCENQTTCRAYFNQYSGNVYIHYYLQTSDGEYENVASIPSIGYSYNSSKSKCNNNSSIVVENNIVTVDSDVEDECYVYFDMLTKDVTVNVWVLNRETQTYELGSVPVTGYTLYSSECTNGATISYVNSTLVVNSSGPTVCTVYFN